MAGVWKPKFKHLCSLCGWQGVRTQYPRKCPKCGAYAPHAIGPATGPLYPLTEHEGLPKQIIEAAVRLAKMLEVADFDADHEIRNVIVKSLSARVSRNQVEKLLGLPLLVNALKVAQEKAFKSP